MHKSNKKFIKQREKKNNNKRHKIVQILLLEIYFELHKYREKSIEIKTNTNMFRSNKKKKKNQPRESNLGLSDLNANALPLSYKITS